MSNVHEIVKYPNRRLYDTRLRSYVTLIDLRQMVLDGVDFTVIEKNTGTDITRSILLIIIAEQERRSCPVLTLGSLRAVIRRQIQQESNLQEADPRESESEFNGMLVDVHGPGPGTHRS
jgi:polyhydroxyalkanoate synthesis repressor PhaR